MKQKQVPGQSSKWQKLKQVIESWEDEGDCSPERPLNKAKPQRTAEELATLAANLESHTAFIRLLQEASEAKWPLIDKGPDKKPNNDHVPPQPQVFSDSALSGSKRLIMDNEPDDQQGSRKRRRT